MKNDNSICSNEELEFYESVILLSAGGTINMEGTKEAKPADGVQKALSSISDALAKENLSCISINLFERAPDSSNIGETEWQVIVDKINEIVERKNDIEHRLLSTKSKLPLSKGGIVVAHGTDTLSITCLVTSYEMLLNNLQCPIVFTGSFSTMDDPKSDAKDNLLRSILVAKQSTNKGQNLKPGVYAVIGNDIHLGSRISKVYTTPNSDGHYFLSFPSPIGQITGKSLQVKIDESYRDDLCKDNYQENQLFSYDKPWGVVEYILIDKFTSPNVIDGLKVRIEKYKADPKYANRSFGVVIQGDFGNNVNFKKITELLYLISKDNVVLVGSKNSYEKMKKTEPFEHLGLIPKSLLHLNAKIKLGWLLRMKLSLQDVIHYMSENMVGEVFATDSLPSWINYNSPPENHENVEVVFAYPNISSKVIEDAVDRLQNISKQKKKLYIYGFGDGHFPTVNAPLADLVQKYLIEEVKLASKDCLIKSTDIESIKIELIEIIKSNSELISKYCKNHFDVDSYKVKAHLRNELAKKLHRKFRVSKLSKLQNALINEFDDDYELTLEHPLFEQFMKLTNWQVDLDKVNDELELLEKKYSVSNNVDYISIITTYLPYIIAQRILKEAVMISNDNMYQIGNAVDKGINVIVKSYAYKSVTNTLRYEAGNMMMMLGVNSDVIKLSKNFVIVRK